MGRVEQHSDTMNVVAVKYLNRLSDLLFILARHANREQAATCCGSPAGSASRPVPAADRPRRRASATLVRWPGGAASSQARKPV